MTGQMAQELTVIRVEALASVADFGYTGGRDSLRTFCRRVFAPGGPPFLRSEKGELVIFRHADVRAIAAAPDLSAVAPNLAFPGILAGPKDRLGFAVADLITNQLFTSNPPLNPALRRVLLNQIGPKPLQAYADRTHQLACDALAALPVGEPVDLVHDLAEPLIGRFWGGLLHQDAESAVATAIEARRMTPMLYLRRDAESAAQLETATLAYRALVEDAAAGALVRGGCPFVEGIAADLAEIHLEDDLDHVGYVPKSAGAFLAGNLFDGFHTAALALTNTLAVLVRHPDAIQGLIDAREKVGAFVAECLRLEPPVIHLNRYTTGDVQCGNAFIPKGLYVSVMWGAANQDPAAFPDPEHFDAGRPLQGTTTFGGGAHICPGRYAVGLIVKSFLEALVESRLQIHPLNDREAWLDNHGMCQLREMPVVLRASA